MAACKVCSGKGAVKCPRCGGKGTRYESSGIMGGSTVQCKNCSGSGVVRCGPCGGKGQIR